MSSSAQIPTETNLSRCPNTVGFCWQQNGGPAFSSHSIQWTLIRCDNPVPGTATDSFTIPLAHFSLQTTISNREGLYHHRLLAPHSSGACTPTPARGKRPHTRQSCPAPLCDRGPAPQWGPYREDSVQSLGQGHSHAGGPPSNAMGGESGPVGL